MPIQSTERVNFGTARLFEATPGGYLQAIANLTDVMIDFTADLKEAYGEGGYPIFVADGHRAINISAKHYNINPTTLADALGGTSAATGAAGMSLDEAGTVPTGGGPYTYTLHTDYVDDSLYLLVDVPNGGLFVPTPYQIVAPGSETTGVSASVTGGVITFAAADSGYNFTASYGYAISGGTRVSVVNTFQNSGKVFSLTAIKRDISTIDNSVAQMVYTFAQVRTAGIKNDYKEGDYTVYERTYKAYADSTGKVCTVDFVNV